MVVLERLLSKPRCVHEMQYLESKIIKFPYANSYTRSFIVLMKCRKHVRVNMTNHLRSTMGKTTYLHSLCFSSLLFMIFTNKEARSFIIRGRWCHKTQKGILFISTMCLYYILWNWWRFLDCNLIIRHF